MSQDLAPLKTPIRVWRWADLTSDRENPPKAAGVYAWWFDSPLPGVPLQQTITGQAGHLLYVGISPRSFADGVKPSRQTLRSRLRYHFRGNAAGSTLRLTLGCVLAAPLGIRLRVVGSGTRLTFGSEGEAALSAWMAEHARVCWLACPSPRSLEEHAMTSLSLPLNLEGNHSHPFHETLSGLRKAAKEAARREWTSAGDRPPS